MDIISLEVTHLRLRLASSSQTSNFQNSLCGVSCELQAPCWVLKTSTTLSTNFEAWKEFFYYSKIFFFHLRWQFLILIILNQRFFLKVRIFWEGHKIWKNLPLKIWRYSVRFFQILWPSQNIPTLTKFFLFGFCTSWKFSIDQNWPKSANKSNCLFPQNKKFKIRVLIWWAHLMEKYIIHIMGNVFQSKAEIYSF